MRQPSIYLKISRRHGPPTIEIRGASKRAISIDVAVSFGLSVRNGQAAGGPATRPNTHRELLIL